MSKDVLISVFDIKFLEMDGVFFSCGFILSGIDVLISVLDISVIGMDVFFS